MSGISLLPKGTDFTRLAIARALGTDMLAELAIIENRWPAGSVSTLNIKAAVAAGTTTDATFAGPLAVSQISSEFLELVRPQTLLGKLNLRRVPLNVTVPAQTAGATVAWVGEGKPAPVTADAFTTVTLPARKLSGLVVTTRELLKTATLDAEALLRADLAAAVVQLSDTTFINPSIAAVAGVSPASVTNGAPSTAAGGTLSTDLTALLNIFTGDLDKATMVTHPATAASIGVRASIGLGNDMGARGGTLAGIPVIVSSAMPAGTIAILDPSQIVFGDSGIDIAASKDASVEMQNPATDPGTASTVMISLWQQNLVSLRVLHFVNWAVSRSGVVATLTGVA